MYKCDIKISIFSRERFWEDTLRGIQPLERFSHSIVTYDDYSRAEISEDEIIIWDLPLKSVPMSEVSSNSALLVICTNQWQDITLSQIDDTLWEDVWIKPIDAGEVGFRFKKIMDKLKLQHDYLLQKVYIDTAIDSIPDLVWFKDIRGAHMKVNQSFCNAVGKTKYDIEGRGHYYIWDMKQEEYEKGEYVCLESEDIVLQQRKTCLFDEKVKGKNGMRQFKTYKSPLFFKDDLIGTVGIAHDVTDLENLDVELEIVLRSMPFAILLTNQFDTIINLNQNFETYFDLKKTDLVGDNYIEWRKDIFPSLEDQWQEAESVVGVYIQGKRKVFSVQEKNIYDIFRNLAGRLCIFRDVTREHMLEEEIMRNANTDFLTGLYNRRYFYEFFGEMRGSHQVSLLYVDLDNFKHVNDTFGHQEGDEALVVSANTLRNSFPQDFIARVGGDEFLILLFGDYTVSELSIKAQALLDNMQCEFRSKYEFSTMSASIGVAWTNDSNLSIDELIKRSDIALYEAKENGKAQFRIY